MSSEKCRVFTPLTNFLSQDSNPLLGKRKLFKILTIKLSYGCGLDVRKGKKKGKSVIFGKYESQFYTQIPLESAI